MNANNVIEYAWLTLDDANSHLAEWTELSKTTQTDVWFTPVWLRTWCRYFAKGRDVVFLLARKESSLVALLPFVIDTMRPSGIRVRVAQLAGPHPLFGVLTLPVLPAVLEDVIAQATQDLLMSHRCDCVSLAPISETFGLHERVSQGIDQIKGAVQHADTCPRPHTVIRLPNSFDTYLGGLSARRRKKYRKTKRILEQEYDVHTKVLCGGVAADALDNFIELHARQWQEQSRLGHFADWPDSASFYKDYCRDIGGGSDVRLYLQTDASDTTISALFCLFGTKSCHALLPARTHNPDFAKLEIGLHAQFERIEHLSTEGISILDSGAGKYDYKASLNSEMLGMHRFLIGRDTSVGRWRMQVLRLYSKALNLLYYRVWFNRIAPRLRVLGLAKGPLWNSWIRTRI